MMHFFRTPLQKIHFKYQKLKIEEFLKSYKFLDFFFVF